MKRLLIQSATATALLANLRNPMKPLITKPGEGVAGTVKGLQAELAKLRR